MKNNYVKVELFNMLQNQVLKMALVIQANQTLILELKQKLEELQDVKDSNNKILQ